jgi:hypothetical protein
VQKISPEVQLNTSEVQKISSGVQLSTSEVQNISSEVQFSTSEVQNISSEVQLSTSEVQKISSGVHLSTSEVNQTLPWLTLSDSGCRGCANGQPLTALNIRKAVGRKGTTAAPKMARKDANQGKKGQLSHSAVLILASEGFYFTTCIKWSLIS